jgi:hypothetical protein
MKIPTLQKAGHRLCRVAMADPYSQNWGRKHLMAESAKTITADEFITCVLRSAWAGLKKRHAGDQVRLQRASEYYFNRLREAKALADVRGLIAELCAEGAPIGELEKNGLTVFWQNLERDWRKCRDIALLTSAT